MIRDDGRKTLTVGDMQTLLSQLSTTMRLEVNAVGNLTITSAENEYIGYIDFAEGVVELFSEEKSLER